MTSRTAGHSPLDTADTAFSALVRGPAPLAVHGADISSHLPQRPIRVTELKRLLLDRRTSGHVRDAAWRELVQRARTGGPSWTVAAVGVALPGLRRVAGRLARDYDGDTADLDAEVLTGFLAALRTVDTSRRRIVLRLCWAAYRAGARHRYADAAPGTEPRLPVTSIAPPRPWGHPDLVLARAVTDQIITADEADLIARTRLDGVPVTSIARRSGEPFRAVLMRRFRAEHKVAEAIVSGNLELTLLPDAP